MKVDWPQQAEKLKDMLVNGEDFSATYNFFFNQFGENLDFLRTSKDLTHPALRALVIEMLEQRFKCKKEKINTMFRRSRLAPDLVHGFFQMPGGGTGMVIYFGSVNKGMLAIPRRDGSSIVDYFRFTTIAVTEDNLTLMPGDPSRIH
ncbi:MAG: hypothetical protein G8237_10265 [Magnetococcales bacterium]|nr:hypothetical protein [Magnetococcales bacterium]NGZ06729.1 hypothetical protein [Magnetococcales bacterium]